MRLGLLVTLLVGALCSCASPTPPRALWLDYDALLIAHLKRPEDLAGYRKGLERIIEHNREEERPVPPGIHGELGVVLLAQDDPAAALERFEQEIVLYAEAARLLEPLMNSARAGLGRTE